MGAYMCIFLVKGLPIYSRIHVHVRVIRIEFKRALLEYALKIGRNYSLLKKLQRQIMSQKRKIIIFKQR